MLKHQCNPGMFQKIVVRGVPVWVGYRIKRDSRQRIKTVLCIEAGSDAKIEERDVPEVVVIQESRREVR